MKKKKVNKKTILIGVVSIMLLSICGLKLIKATAEETNGEKEIYSLKYAYNARADGWFDAFKIYIKNDGNSVYDFNGYNLKYDKLDGYYIPVIDENDEIIYKIDPPSPTLAYSDDYREDIKSINNLFNEKQFKNKITLDDVKNLNLTNLDKEYIVNLFNKAIDSEELTEQGEYIDNIVYGRVETESTDSNLKGKYILTYTIDYGYISNVYIDFENNNGEYISSKTERSINEQSLINLFDSVEKEVLNSNSNDLKKIKSFTSKSSSDNSKKDLQTLISKFEEKLNTNKTDDTSNISPAGGGFVYEE